MGEKLASQIETVFRNHVEKSATWALIEEGRGLTPSQATELSATLAGGLLAGLKTLARAIDDPAEADAP